MLVGVRVLRVAHQACARYVHRSPTVDRRVQFKLSDIGEGIREVTLKGWFVKEDDVVSQFDDVCDVESDKATVTITSRYDGRVAKLHHVVGGKALVGEPLLDIDVAEEEVAVALEVVPVVVPEAVPVVPPEVNPPEDVPWNKSLATPAVRRIAMEHNMKLNEVKGTGKNGRVMKEDILAHLEKRGNNVECRVRVTNEVAENITVTPLSQVQRVMARKMTESLHTPSFVFTDEVEVSKTLKVIVEAKEAAAKKGVKLSVLPILLKAISKSVLEYPVLNSSYDESGHIIYKHNHNFGLAVDTPGGLVVPNIKNVQELSVLEIAKELGRLKVLSSQMKLQPSDLAGGTLTVSNIGSIAGTYATPLILPPEVCIIAVGRIRRLPSFDSEGNVVAVDIITTSWTADHRIIDGATVARCFNVFRGYMEHPTALLLDL